MTTSDINSRYAADLVGGLADAGCEIAFISPGSRNTPLTLAFVNEPRIVDVSVRDERSAAFTALGYAKATGIPAIVACTSGSAAANYLPGIVEADQSATPMIVLTADRPIRLRGTGAPQTMDQTDLYGTHVKAFVELVPGTDDSGGSQAGALCSVAIALPAGPVHANIPFDEPLVPSESIPPATPADRSRGKDPVVSPTGMLSDLEGRKVFIVVGGRSTPNLPALVCETAERLAAPVFCDPQANIIGPTTLSCGDLIVGAGALEYLRPDVVLRIGPIPTSKPMWQWLETSGVEQILLESSRLSDPLGSAETVINADPAAVLRANPIPVDADRSFLESWLSLDAAAHSALEDALTELPFPNEPLIARTVTRNVPAGSVLFVASSRPIRDVDAFAAPRHDVRILANRGLNGIDGTISTAMGVALSGTPTTLLIGDVAALHDASALSEVARLNAPLRIIVVNNDGGGIFSFLPQASNPVVDVEVYERHWGTPHGLSLANIARAMGLHALLITSLQELEQGVAAPIAGPQLIEIETDRKDNRHHHEIIRESVAAVLDLGGGEEIEQRS